MVVNKKLTGRAMPLPAGLAIGLAVSIAVTMLFAALITQMIIMETVGEEWIGYGAMLLLPIAAALGAVVTALTVKRRWLLVCLGAGVVYFIFLLAINSFFFGGQFCGVGVTAVLVLVGALGVGLWGLRGEGRSKRRKLKYRSR